ncbi:MAG TPA: phosphodiester glycosidase family protein [Thermoanaerobaculia bacterium]|jgi:hypothetical protein|nr:phosphodiester glycosidase family protein [Thermoanaerobaculia bacterium]
MAFAFIAALSAASVVAQPVEWKKVQTGVELAILPRALYVVRIDPARAQLRAGLASEGLEPRTAGQWCQAAGYAVAINIGMFQQDHRSNVGHLRNGRHFNNRRWNKYQSVLALNPALNSSGGALPPLLWIDLDQTGRPPELDRYGIVVQNLRLIASPGRNVWAKSEKQWSEAALAVDTKGWLLFVFSREPYAMRDFNQMLLKLPIGITRAMHVEGGPEASLSIHVPGLDLDLCGSYETGFLPDDSNREQWPLPNVLGVLREDAKR